MRRRESPHRRLRPARERPPTLRQAADVFLAQPDLAPSSYRSYAQTLGRLGRDLGPERPLEWVCGRELERAVVEAWGGCAPATWNRHVATVRSFSAFCVRRGWVGEPFAEVLARRREPADRTRAIPFAQLERLWRRDDVAVREKALWRLLYETAARAGEVLSLNVEDVELENKRARVRSKGGDVEWLHLQAGSAPRAGRLGAASAALDRWPSEWPAVLGRPAAGAGTDASCRRSVPVHGAGSVVLPARGGAVQRGVGWVDAAPAAPLGDHASRRGRRRARVADGQEPSYVIALAAALRPPGSRGGREADRRARSQIASVYKGLPSRADAL